MTTTSRLKHGEDAMKALVERKSPEEVGAFFEELARRGFDQADRTT